MNTGRQSNGESIGFCITARNGTISGRHRDNGVAGEHGLGPTTTTTTDVLIEMDQGFVSMIAKHGMSRGTNRWGQEN